MPSSLFTGLGCLAASHVVILEAAKATDISREREKMIEVLVVAIFKSFFNSHGCVVDVWDRELKDATGGHFARLKEVEHFGNGASKLMLIREV